MRSISQEIRNVAVFFLAASTFNLDSNRLIQRGGEGLPSACFHPNFILEITHRGVVSFCALVLNSYHMWLGEEVLFLPVVQCNLEGLRSPGGVRARSGLD